MSGYNNPPIGFNFSEPAYPPMGQGGGPGYPPQGAPGYPPTGIPGNPTQGGPGYAPGGPMGGPGNLPYGGQSAAPGAGYGGAPGYGAPPSQQPGYGDPGAMGPGYGAPPPAMGYGAPPQHGGPGYGAPPPHGGPGYGAPPPQGDPGYGAPPPQGGPGYGAPPPHGGPGYGAPPPGAGSGYGAPPQGYGGAPGYGAPPPHAGPGYGAPPSGGMGYAGASMGGGGGGGGKYYSGRPTVVPVSNFDPGQDANGLKKAMKGFGCNNNTVIAILTKRTAAQRQQICQKYKASFGKDLAKDLEGELHGKLEDVVLRSLMNTPTMLADSLYKSMKGAGTKEWALIQVLVPYSNSIIQQTVQAYAKLLRDKGKSSSSNLEKDIRGDTSGDFEKILVSLMQGCREENSPVDAARAQADADELYQAGEKRMGTEEATFTRILSQRSFEQIKAIAACYQQKHSRTLVKAIEKEMSGYYEKTLVSIVRFAENKNELLASWFYDSMAGLGTNDEILIGLVLGRCEIDLQDVKDAYNKLKNKPLAKAIAGDTSGDYEKILLALVGP